ncbi:tryptophan synthase subunit alpha [Streptomyces albus subsp. chlorinus]|uniref:tryptophan synthase subunit alpha n=1 Tax=Streptomyces albus TaxID=1888 RepID=UPI003D0B32E3
MLEQRQPVLCAFSVAGYPDERAGVEALVAYARNGASVLEVGAPTTDPWLDGPVIAAAHRRALRSGGGDGVAVTLATVRQVSALTRQPVVVMSYWATVAARGPQRMANELAASGASGCMVADIPPEEVESWTAAAARAGISAPLLAGREAPPGELAAVCRAATGFVYAPAVAGQRTGYSDGLDLEALASFVASVRRAAPRTPVLSGIGVSTPGLAASVARRTGVNGVVIGSPLIRAYADGGPDAAVGLLGEFAASVSRAR